MNLYKKEIRKYLHYCFNLKKINVIFSEIRNIDSDLLNEYQLCSINNIKDFDITKSSINDLLITNSGFFENKDVNDLKKLNLKIIILGNLNIRQRNIGKDFNILYKSNFILNIFNIGIYVIQRRLSKEETNILWQDYYGYHLDKFYENRKLEFIFSWGHKYISKYDKEDKIVVDFGCGNGQHANYENIRKIKKYYFVDCNIETVNYLINVKKYKDVILSDGTELPFEDCSIDYFICSHILEHVNNINKIIDNIYDKLKFGGGIILVMPCDPGFMWNLLAKCSPNRKRLKHLGLEYDDIMKAEHINTITNVLTILRRKFEEGNTFYFPFNFIKKHNFNLMYFAEFKKIK